MLITRRGSIYHTNVFALYVWINFLNWNTLRRVKPGRKIGEIIELAVRSEILEIGSRDQLGEPEKNPHRGSTSVCP